MPIEFSCSQCGKRLRVGDDAAGKQAKCPSCGAVQPVPVADRAPEAAQPARDNSQRLSPGDNVSQFPSGNVPRSLEPSDNPYAAPAESGMPLGGFGEPSGPRHGPAWERNGASIGSFLATVKEFYLAPLQFFLQMRREGGLGAPLSFAAAGSMIGFSATVIYALLIQAITGQNEAFREIPAGGPERVGFMIGAVIGSCCCPAVIGPLIALVCILLSAAVFHLTLTAFGSANFSYETTARVVAYVVGSTMLMPLLPICGFYLSPVAQAIYCAIGLAYAQECSGGAAAAAVLLPAMLCGAAGLTLLFAVVFMIGA
jgi:hypothetical protein